MRGNILLVLLILVGGVFVIEGSEKWEVVDEFEPSIKFGQISGVSLDTAGNVWVFHRGNHVWDDDTFDFANVYRLPRNAPIAEPAIVVLDAASGVVKARTGRGMFFIPHGLTIDHENNVWLTDVALHQVFKFSPPNMTAENDLGAPRITLGTRFTPGSDVNHFCKPTDVAVDKYTGDFYVSDGYCNSYVKKFDERGALILSWGRKAADVSDPYGLAVPHALSIAVDDKLLYVADRENSRAVSYSTDSGAVTKTYQELNKVYSVAYSSARGKKLFTLSNSVRFDSPGVATVYDAETRVVVGRFAPPGNFATPHDISVSRDGLSCFVVELNPARVWKFAREDGRKSGNGRTRGKVARINGESVSDVAAEASRIVANGNVTRAGKVPAEGEAKDEAPGGETLLAVGIVSFIIVVIFLIFAFHVYRRKANYPVYEMRRLILDDEEDVRN